MRTIFTSEDIKEIIKDLFNSSDEKIAIVDESGEKTEILAKDYLNLNFYTYKLRHDEEDNAFGSFSNSLNTSNCLIEMTDSDVATSQDIDSATYEGKCTCIMQTEKAQVLEMFLMKLRNNLLGVPQDIQNCYGEKLKAYFVIGILSYDGEPEETQFGETIQVSFNFTITYLTSALTYNDTPMFLSFNGQDFFQVPYTNGTIQTILGTKSLPKQNRPDICGFIATNLTKQVSLTFFDFNNELNKMLDEFFWQLGAVKIDGVATDTQSVNKEIYMKITANNHDYLYKYIIGGITKTFKNGDFTTSNLQLLTSAKGD